MNIFLRMSPATKSPFSDAASVVLYHTFEAMANMSSISIKEVSNTSILKA